MISDLVIFWFRRDLRLYDNTALYHALRSGDPVLPLFIFDSNILESLEKPFDKRLEFIAKCLQEIDAECQQFGSALLIRSGDPFQVWQELIKDYSIKAVYTNLDYEPYAVERDKKVTDFLHDKGIAFHLDKDQVIYHQKEIVKADKSPYTIFTPYKNKWLDRVNDLDLVHHNSQGLLNRLTPLRANPFSLQKLGFKPTHCVFPDRKLDSDLIKKYDLTRDFPAIEGTSRLGIHLRFGTVSIREIVRQAISLNQTWLSELIWREFFTQILSAFPKVVDQPFKSKYSAIDWRNDPLEFEKWCQGKTGYPMVDAGMRQLNETGYMHNRVRMVTASFLTKHLLIDWRKGERYFARHLLDYDLAANNGNWQWAAGCGCDAAPYFRIFSPQRQTQRFDRDQEYIRKWIPELGSPEYPSPIIDHAQARHRAILIYKQALDR